MSSPPESPDSHGFSDFDDYPNDNFNNNSNFLIYFLNCRVFKLLPAAVVDIIEKYTKYQIVEGKFVCSFGINPHHHIVSYQHVWNGHGQGGDGQSFLDGDVEIGSEIGIITRHYSSDGNQTIYTIYNLTGDVIKKVNKPHQGQAAGQPSLIPIGLDDDADYTFFNSEFNCVWHRQHQWRMDDEVFGHFLSGQKFTCWINEKTNVIHLGGGSGAGGHGGGHGGGHDEGIDYPLQLPSWVSVVSYSCIGLSGEFLYLFCGVRDKSSKLLFKSSEPSKSSRSSRLCLFTLKGQFVKYIIEVKADFPEDFVVTVDQQIFMLKKSIWRSYKLERYSSTSGELYETIDIDGCDSWQADLSQLKSGHLAVALHSDHMWDTQIHIYQ